jgi:hypothetical protein
MISIGYPVEQYPHLHLYPASSFFGAKIILNIYIPNYYKHTCESIEPHRLYKSYVENIRCVVYILFGTHIYSTWSNYSKMAKKASVGRDTL